MGTLAATTREEAANALAAKGLFPVELRLDASGGADRRASMPTNDLALGLRMLASLLEAGLPMERALAIYATLAPAGWKPEALEAIRASVREGKSLASALAGSPIAIPPVVLGMIEAGEAGSGLAESVRRAAGLMERVAATRAAIRGALVYPAILAVAGTLSVALLVGVVLPRFATIVEDLGESLPASTQFVLAASSGARAMAVPATIFVIVAVLAWRHWLAGSETARAGWHGALLGVPVAGPMRRAASASRVSAALSALLTSGVPIAGALLHVARAAGDAAVSHRLLDARQRVVAGERLSSALTHTDALTASTVQLVRAGEATGDLAGMLEHASRIEGEWAEQRVKGLVRIVEPILILIFGVIVAVIAASLLQAVYSVRPVA
jgi:general secretion pathway protein F